MSKRTQSDRIKAASRKRRERQKAETRQAIIDAASELFLEHGYENFSLRQVAEQIGYSPGTIYLYFDNKDDLLFTIADEGFQRFGAALQAAVDAAPDAPQQQLEGMARNYITFGLENPVHYRLMFMERTDFMIREHDHDGDRWIDTFYILQQSVERGMAIGIIPQGNAEAVSDVLWSMVHGLVAIAIRMEYIPEERIERATEQAIRVLREGIYTP
jgi:AcrR family transcriptional regulator